MSRKQIEINRNLWHAVDAGHRAGRSRDPARSRGDAHLLRRRRAGRPTAASTPTIDHGRPAGPSAGPSAEGRRDHRPGHRRRAAGAADRAAVVGVRQLRDAVQGLRPEGRAARPVREGRRRGAGPPLHRRRADGRAAHPVGQGRRLRRPRAPRRATAASPWGRSTRTRSRTTTTCSAASATRTPASAARPSTTCSSASTSWTRPGRATSSCGSPTGPTTRARTTSAAARTASPRRCATVYDRLGAGPADRPRVQVLRAVVLHDGRARLGHGARPLPRARRPKAKVVVDTGHHAPGHEHRVHRRVSCCASGKLGALRLQLAVLRRRRPDGRRRRTRSSCSGSCTRSCSGGAPRARLRRRVHARPVPQHRAQDPGPDPVGDERPGGDGQGAARRPARRSRPRRRPVTSSARTPS